MAMNTEHYNLFVPEGNDLFNPLVQEAANMRSIDSNMWDNRQAAVQKGNELKSGTVHAITIPAGTGAMFRFVATSKWTAGDTCTVNGAQVSTLLPNGQTLPDGAWVINSNVLCCLEGTVLTCFVGGGGGAEGEIDADTLEGHPASYFATATAVQAAQQAATASGQIAQNAQATADGTVTRLDRLTPNVKAIVVTSSLPSNPDANTLYLIPQ